MKELNIEIAVKIYDYEELDAADRELMDAAREATNRSYAPFFTRPISLILLIISVLCVFWPYISDHLKAKKAAKNPAPTAANVDVNDD